MRLQWIAGLLITTICAAQTPMPVQPSAAQVAPAEDTLVVPAGTVIPLTLDRAITRKARIGDSVTATVAFPVTIGNRFAIPVGTDVTGVITAVTPRDKKTHQPTVAIHFMRMTYPSGYTLTFDAINTVAVVMPPALSSTAYADAALGEPRAYGPNPAADQQNPFPNQPTGKLTPGEKTTILIAGPLAFIGLIFLLIHFASKSAQSNILFDAGWQFQITTQSTFTLDTSKIGAIAH